MKNKSVYINGRRYDGSTQITTLISNRFNDKEHRAFNNFCRNIYGRRPVLAQEEFIITFEDGRTIEFVPSYYRIRGNFYWFETENEIQTA